MLWLLLAMPKRLPCTRESLLRLCIESSRPPIIWGLEPWKRQAEEAVVISISRSKKNERSSLSDAAGARFLLSHLGGV